MNAIPSQSTGTRVRQSEVPRGQNVGAAPSQHLCTCRGLRASLSLCPGKFTGPILLLALLKRESVPFEFMIKSFGLL